MVLLLMMLGALAELATIGAVVPFLALLANAGNLSHFPWIAGFLSALGPQTAAEQLRTVTAFFILFALAGALLRLQLTWSSQALVFKIGHEIALEIERRILFQPYEFHLSSSTSALVAALEKVQMLTSGVLLPMLQAGTSIVISLFIVAALIYVDPFAAAIAALTFSFLYILISALTRRRLIRNSAELASAYDERIKIVQEGLGGIRDVIIDNSQDVYLEAFRRVDQRFNIAQANTGFIAAAPRFVIEALGMVLIATVAVLLTEREGGFPTALLTLGALAVGAQRLLPLLQQTYVGWSLAAGNSSILTDVMRFLVLPLEKERSSVEQVEPLPLREKISIEHVSFTYPNRRAPALADIALEIPRGQSVALIGRTGSGKSTLADLLMGLLEPSSGQIKVDGVPLTRENRRRWQRNIAHVPQSIYLADGSIARNIAFGLPAEQVDMARVKQAAADAQLAEFIENLPDGYETRVGERGVRLSGGQRQRLGIARAIYKGTPVLVLDEATSALDDATESAVMEALDRLGAKGRTIIMIAHRLSTVARAAAVVRLDNGRVAKLGSHADVIGNGSPRQVR